MTAGDFNGDGKTDLFLYNIRQGWLYQAISTGTGAFTLTFGTWGTNWQVLQITDLNGDGFSDVLWYDPSFGQWNQEINTGAGAFTNKSSGFWQPGLTVIATMPRMP